MPQPTLQPGNKGNKGWKKGNKGNKGNKGWKKPENQSYNKTMAMAAHSLPLWHTHPPPPTHSTAYFSYWAFPITWYTTQQKDHRYTIKIQICTILLKTLSHHLLPIPQPISPTGHFPSLGYSQTKDNIIIKTKVFCCGTLTHHLLPIPTYFCYWAFPIT